MPRGCWVSARAGAARTLLQPCSGDHNQFQAQEGVRTKGRAVARQAEPQVVFWETPGLLYLVLIVGRHGHNVKSLVQYVFVLPITLVPSFPSHN